MSLQHERLCPECVNTLESAGYITAPERNSEVRGACELCGRTDVPTKEYYYTLSSAARARRLIRNRKEQ